MKKLLILGGGGHGKVVAEAAMLSNQWEEIAFLDDYNSKATVGCCSEYENFVNEYKYAIPAFGNNEFRKSWFEKLEKAGFQLPTIIHPSAYISPSSKIYRGSVILANSTINTGCTINYGCIINIGVLIDHDTHVGEFVHVSSGAIVRSMCEIGDLSTVDAGAVIPSRTQVTSQNLLEIRV